MHALRGYFSLSVAMLAIKENIKCAEKKLIFTRKVKELQTLVVYIVRRKSLKGTLWSF